MKLRKRRGAAWLAACFMCCGCMTGCGKEKPVEIAVTQIQETIATNGAVNQIQETAASNGEVSLHDGKDQLPCYRQKQSLAGGQYQFGITRVRLAESMAEVENPNGFLGSDASISLIHEQKDWVTYTYPEFVREDGSFLEGVNLILVDMEFKNLDAKGEPETAWQEAAQVEGRDWPTFDPYVFRADSLLYLQDLTHGFEGIINTDQYGNEHRSIHSWSIDYFSKLNDRPEHRIAFWAEPGETIQFTVGFLVSDQDETGQEKPLPLCLTGCVGSEDDVLTTFHLNELRETP